MRIARILTPGGPVRGRYDDGRIITDEGSYEIGRDGHLLPPTDPTTIYCVGRNYADTLDHMEYDRPAEPTFFMKPRTALVAHELPIRYPSFTNELTYAGELAAVIGERCRNLSPETARESVRGYTILNDVDAIDQANLPARKAFDGSAPLGPWLETNLDPMDLSMHTDINGERRQDGTTRDMLFAVDDILSYLSRRFTFEPGDVVAFGSPPNPGVIEPGDVVEITYEGIGTLRNKVISQKA